MLSCLSPVQLRADQLAGDTIWATHTAVPGNGKPILPLVSRHQGLGKARRAMIRVLYRHARKVSRTASYFVRQGDGEEGKQASISLHVMTYE